MPSKRANARRAVTTIAASIAIAGLVACADANVTATWDAPSGQCVCITPIADSVAIGTNGYSREQSHPGQPNRLTEGVVGAARLQASEGTAAVKERRLGGNVRPTIVLLATRRTICVPKEYAGDDSLAAPSLYLLNVAR